MAGAQSLLLPDQTIARVPSGLMPLQQKMLKITRSRTSALKRSCAKHCTAPVYSSHVSNKQASTRINNEHRNVQMPINSHRAIRPSHFTIRAAVTTSVLFLTIVHAQARGPSRLTILFW